MKLFTIQIALFPKDQIDRPDKLKEIITQRMGEDLFDAMPMILNIPQNVPDDFPVPIVQASSTNGRYALNIGRKRIDFIVNPDYYDFSEPMDAYNAYKAKIDKYFKAVTSYCDLLRIGIVYNLFEETQQNVKAIFDKYLKQGFNAKCVETTIRTNTQKQIGKMLLNNIKIVEAGTIHITRNNAAEDKQGVLIQFDINNVPEQQNKLTNDKIITILSSAAKVLESSEIKEMI